VPRDRVRAGDLEGVRALVADAVALAARLRP
jgi:2-dehydro-3-deoxyphosphogluconate aldolase/(4S)-4-hydroxy-2-oxoglutarate aldolase